MLRPDRISTYIQNSPFISRDLSWIRFNERVLDQARHAGRTIFEKLKFLAITSSNQDEFFMIRVGSLYNYIELYRTPKIAKKRQKTLKKRVFCPFLAIFGPRGLIPIRPPKNRDFS